MITIEELRETARQCIVRIAAPELVAATLEWDAEQRHLRLNFFLDGIAQDIDLEPFELALGEVIATRWHPIETAGTTYSFDGVLNERAHESPLLVFSR
jgi:hypothetical protein